MMLGGIVVIIFGDFIDGLWSIVLGWLIMSGAETSLKQTVVSEALTGVSVADIMEKNVLTVPPEITVQQLVSDYFLTYHHDAYPVVKDGQVLGLVTLQCVRNVPQEKREYETVQHAMTPLEQALVVKPSMKALDAMQSMARVGAGRALVVDDDRLVGIATNEDIVRTIRTRQNLELGQPAPSTPTASVRTEHCIQCGALLVPYAKFCSECGAKQTVNRSS
jgi:CBS domain-containing protein